MLKIKAKTSLDWLNIKKGETYDVLSHQFAFTGREWERFFTVLNDNQIMVDLPQWAITIVT